MAASAPKKKPGARRVRPRLPEGLKKPRPEAVLKNLPREKQAELWRLARNSGFSTAQALERAAEIAGQPISPRQFIEWRAWYPIYSRWDEVKDVAAALLENDGTVDGDKLRERGLVLLMGESLKLNAGDGFIAAAREHRSGRELQVNVEKFRHAVKSAAEKALEFLAEDIKGNPQALAAVAQLKKAVIKKTVEAVTAE